MLLTACQSAPGPQLDHLDLPPGFQIAPLARVPGARALLVAEAGAKIYVATRDGEVFAILDPERDGTANEVIAVAGGLEAPHGLALGSDGALLVAEQHRILELADGGGAQVVVPPGVLPDRGRRGSRHAGIGPDGRLYVAIGASCGPCEAKGFEGTIVRLRPDGHELEIYARGVRDAVGFDWHPLTGELFFIDGSGEAGDPVAPDELNRASEPGLHFGFPYVYGDGTPYPQFAGRAAPQPTISPALTFDARAGALGIDFYAGRMFPADYRHDALVAQHGSLSRAQPVGYRVMRVRFSPAGQPQGMWVFIDGWLLADGTILGRPVDLEELPDGSLLISDDHAGMVYRVTYHEPGR